MLDLDPERNRKQFETIRSSTAKSMLVTRKGFWFFIGGMFVFASPFIYFADPKSVSGSMSQTESALFSLALGTSILVATFLFTWLWQKLSNYKPLPNKGDEWLK